MHPISDETLIIPATDGYPLAASIFEPDGPARSTVVIQSATAVKRRFYAEYAADLFWLLHQGHILLFTDDTLVVQEIRETPAPDPNAEPKSGKKKKKKKNKKPQGEEGESAKPETESEETPAASDESPTDSPAEESTPEIEATIVSEAPESPAAELVDAAPYEEISVSDPTPEPVAETSETPTEEPASSPTEEEMSKNPSAGVDEPSPL